MRKREGDGATPTGRFDLRRVFYRRDHVSVQCERARPIREQDGWCEVPGDRNYNRLVKLPYAVSHETMKRRDRLYDIVVELSHNQKPRVQGRGSAVFFHLRRTDGGPTAGCVAVNLKDMQTILRLTGGKAQIIIWP